MHLIAVDDEPAILELLQLIIQTFGAHTVETASCVTDALELVARPDCPEIDCFLIDIQMPDTDGIALCEILRDHPRHSQAPIVMLTAMADKSYVDKAFAAGATDYITKPFDIDDLRGRIQLIEGMTRRDQPEVSIEKTETDTDYPSSTTLALHEPVFVQDVEGCITYMALENYVSLMSRKKLFGSSIVGFTIREIAKLHRDLSRYEYECLVTDVAEAISIALKDQETLLSYAGNGTYICVVQDGAQLKPDALADQVNLTLRKMDLYYSDGTPMSAAVSAGDLVRLVWKSGRSAVEALAVAHESAERESGRHARSLEDFWYNRRSV